MLRQALRVAWCCRWAQTVAAGESRSGNSEVHCWRWYTERKRQGIHSPDRQEDILARVPCASRLCEPEGNITVDGKALSKRGNLGKINVSQHGVTDWSQIEAKGAGAGSVFRAAWVVVYPPGEGRTNAWDQCYLVAP